MKDVMEQKMVASLQKGQPEALGLLYDKYAPVLLGLITRMVQDSETAEVVLQKTFAAIWLQRATYDATKLRLLSWIILIARDMAKAALPKPINKVFSITEENSKFTTEETRKDSEAPVERQVQEFCSRLEQSERMALQLVYLKGYSCEEAAAQLGIPVETLKVNLRMAVKHLGAERAA